MPQFGAYLSIVVYDHQAFIVQATGFVLQSQKSQNWHKINSHWSKKKITTDLESLEFRYLLMYVQTNFNTIKFHMMGEIIQIFSPFESHQNTIDATLFIAVIEVSVSSLFFTVWNFTLESIEIGLEQAPFVFLFYFFPHLNM